MAKLLRSYYDFRGGLNTDAAPDNLMDNELVQADNIDLLERGGIAKRKGYIRLNNVSYGGQVEQIFEWPRDNGEVWLMAVVDVAGTPRLFRVREDQGYRLEEVARLASPRVGYFFLQDKLYFVDGASYRVWDGETVQDVPNYEPEPPEDEEQPEEPVISDLTPIRRCRFLVRHPNSYRIFAAGDPENASALYYSEPNEPGFFKKVSVLHPTTGDGPVQNIVAFGDALLVFYRHSVWAWRGLDPEEDATWIKLPTGVGTDAPYSIALTPGSLTFFGQSGIYALSPAVLDMNVTIEPTEGLILNFAANKVEALLRQIRIPERAVAVFDSNNQRYMLAYGEGEDAVRNNRILVFDWTLRAFTRYTNLFVNDFCYRLNGDLLAATNGYILKMNTGYNDHNQPIEMRVRTKQFNLDHPFHKKNLLRLYIGFRQPEQGTSLLTLRLYVDDILRGEIIEAALYENFVWGESKWGDIWGYRSTVTTRTRIYGSGHRVQVEFFNAQPDDPTTIYGIAFEFRPKRAKGRLL